MNKSTVNDCKIIELGQIHNRAGNLTVINNTDIIPFEVKRIYYLYDIPGGAERGGHAHKNLMQLIIAASGSFDVKLDDGKSLKIINLNHPNIGILIIPGIWRELSNFSSGSICLVLASELYDEADYIRNIQEFNLWKNNEKP